MKLYIIYSTDTRRPTSGTDFGRETYHGNDQVSCPWSPLQANMSMSNPSDVTGTWTRESNGRNGLVPEMVMMVETKQAICNESSWMEF